MRKFLTILFGIAFFVSCSGAVKESIIEPVLPPAVEEQVVSETQKAIGDEVEVEKEDAALKVTLDDILFQFNKTNLKLRGRKVLDKLIVIMKEYPTTVVHITGHSDNIGPKKAKAKIASGRAKTVAKYLKKHGIAAKRITYKGLSDKKPRFPNNSRLHRQKNRRVEMRLEVKKDTAIKDKNIKL